MSELHRPQRAIAAGCSSLLIFLFLSMLGLILLAAGIHLLRSTVPRAFAALYLVLPWAFLVLCAAGLGKLPLSPRRFAFALGLASLLAKGAVALLVQTPPESDFYLLYYAARELARGNNILNETQYFQFWAYQSGFVAWMAFFIRVFHAGLPFFLAENVAASSATTVLIYVLCKRVATHRSAAVAALVYLCYPASFFLIPVLTNQFLSELCLAGALCLYLDPRQRARGCLLAAGVLLAVGNIFRPMSMVVVLAVVGAAVLGLLGGRGLWESALPCLLLCTGYFAVTQGASLWVRLSGLNANGLTNQLPLWKLLLGLNQATSGRYSGADATLVFQSSHPAAAAEALLRERLAAYDLSGLLRLFWAKISLMWGSFEDSSWALTGQALDALGARGAGQPGAVLGGQVAPVRRGPLHGGAGPGGGRRVAPAGKLRPPLGASPGRRALFRRPPVDRDPGALPRRPAPVPAPPGRQRHGPDRRKNRAAVRPAVRGTDRRPVPSALYR